MKKIGIILLTLLMLTACGSKDDVDTAQLLNDALNKPQATDKNAFDLSMDMTLSGSGMKASAEFTGQMRQTKSLDVESITKGDLSALEGQITGTMDMGVNGGKSDFSFYIKDGIYYIDMQGSKLKLDFGNLLSGMTDMIPETELSKTEIEQTVWELTKEDLKDFEITKEKGFYRYSMSLKTIKQLVKDKTPEAMDLFEGFTDLKVYLDVNNDASLRTFGAVADLSNDGIKINTTLEMSIVDFDSTKDIVFPDFSDYIDLSGMGF